MPIKSELLACPFCGAQAEARKLNSWSEYPWFVEVEHKRGCEIALTDHASRTSHRARSAAIRRWNTRTPPNTEGQTNDE